MLPPSKTSQALQRSNDQLSASFRCAPPGTAAEILRISAPETGLPVDKVSEFCVRVQTPPPRLAPPGHESFVSLASVKDDPNQVIVNCEDESCQEKSANLALSDDVTVVDPNEEVIDLANKEVNLHSFINKCLRVSVKHTKSATRDTRLMGLRSLRAHSAVGLTACSNLESEDEDCDLDDDD